MRVSSIWASLLAAVFFLPAVALAQLPSPTGSVYGTALDVQGNPVPNVAVTLSGASASDTSQSDAEGDFHFPSLSPGTYTLTLERAGFATTRRSVTVPLGTRVSIVVTLSVAGATESVVVSGDAATSTARTAQTGVAFERPELSGIPSTRDPWAFLRQAPGVLLSNVNVGGGQSAQQPNFVGKGSAPDQNLYILDGVGVSVGGITPLYFDFDSLDSIRVTTGGADPSLPTPGVTLNLVTKRGTNRFAGSARGLYTDGSRWDYGAEAGGPLWKDRVWLWAAGASNAFLGQTLFLPDGEPVRSQETQTYWNAKLNAQPAPSNTLTLSFLNFEREAQGRGASPSRSQESTWDQAFPSRAYRIEDFQVFSPRLFASLDSSYVPAHLTNTPEGGPDQQADRDADGVWRHSYTLRTFSLTQHQTGATVSTFFDTGRVRHELKAGFGYRNATFDSLTSWPGDRMFGVANIPSPEAAVTRESNQHYVLQYYDAYLADTFQAGSLTVSLGLRFDDQRGRNLPSSVTANPVFPDLLPAVRYGGDSGYPIAWRSVEPRVGVAWNVAPDGATLVRASYARFANQLGTEISSVNAFPGSALLYYAWTDANGNGRVEPGEVGVDGRLLHSANVDPSDPGSAVPVNQISPNLRAPTTDEFVIGIEHRLLSDLSGSVAYTHRVLRGIEDSPLIGTTRASYRYMGNAAGTAVSASNGFVLNFDEPYYGLATAPVGSQLENRPDTTQTYDGVELQVVKAYSHGWMARLSVGYNDWQQHIGAGGIVNPNNETPGTNASGPVVAGGTNACGPVGAGGTNACGPAVVGGINAPWQFNVGGLAALPFGLVGGVNLFGRQGFPIPYWVRVVANDTDGSRPAIQIGSATTYRNPNVYQLDLQLSRPFLVGARVTLTPEIDCFNVAGSRTVLQRQGFVGTYDASAATVFVYNTGQFNAVSQVLANRTFRGGLRVSF